MSEEVYMVDAPLTITFPLHELLSLSLLYNRAPDDLDLVLDGIWYGQSCDDAYQRIAEALARFIGDKETLLALGALRATKDQQRASG